MTDDTPVLRDDILNMSQSDYEMWLIGVRDRQMANRRKYEEVERAKSLARVDKLTPKLEKAMSSLSKKMDKVDDTISKIAILINKVVTLSQEIDDEQKFAALGSAELELDGTSDRSSATSRDQANLNTVVVVEESVREEDDSGELTRSDEEYN